MGKKIAVIQGHPDPAGKHFCQALASSYVAGALAGDHEIATIAVAGLEFPLLRSQRDFVQGEPPETIVRAQRTIAWSEHLLVIYPLWVGSMPALLKGFFEQLLRPGFAISADGGGFPRKLLTGKSARVVVTMGMPAPVYRWYFGAHSLKSLERNVLGICGIGPIKANIVGTVEARSTRGRKKWLSRMHRLGRAGR